MEKIKNFFAKPQVCGFVLSMAIIAVISLAFFYPDNFEGRSLQQPDMQQGAANGHEAAMWEQTHGEKTLWTNALFGGMPTFQISPSYPSNKLYTWFNSAYGLWLPAPSNLLFMMMFGFLILMAALRKKWYIGLIGAIAWGFSSYFIIIIGAGHIWKFVTLAYVPPTIAGFLLLYRGRYAVGSALLAFFAMMQLNANHPQMTYYFGLVMVIIALCFLVSSLRRKRMRRWFAASGLAIGAGLLAVGANLPSLYNTYEYAKHSQRAQSELAEPNAQSTGGMDRDAIVAYSYGPTEMFSLVVPNIKGGASAKPVAGEMHIASLLETKDSSEAYQPSDEVLAVLPQYFNNSEGTNGPVYVGAILVALFLLGCFIVRGPLKWALVISTIMSLLFALGYNAMALSNFLIDYLPMYNKFRAVESILVVAEFCIPLLGMLALAELLERGHDEYRRLRIPLAVSFGLPAAVSLLALLAPKAFGPVITERDIYNNNLLSLQQYVIQYAMANQIDPNAVLYDYQLENPAVRQRIETARAALVRKDGAMSLLWLALGFGLLSLYATRRLGKTATVTAVGAIILIDLTSVDKRYVNHDSFGAPVDATSQGIVADAIDMAILRDTDPHYRVLDIPGFFQARRSYFHKTVGGYHAAKISRYNDLILNKLSALSPEILSPAASPRAANARAVADMLNARYIITGNPDKPVVLNTGAMGNAWLVDSIVWVDGARNEMDALDVATNDLRHSAIADLAFRDALPQQISVAPGDSVRLTSYSPNRLEYEVSTTNGGVAVFSEVYYPWGWKATIDGNPASIARVNYILRALAVPAGTHRIELSFDPDSVATTSSVAYACVTLIYLLLAAAAFIAFRNWRLF